MAGVGAFVAACCLAALAVEGKNHSVVKPRVMLYDYKGDSMPPLDAWKPALDRGFDRSVAIPEGYVPVIIPEGEVERVANLVGDNRMLMLTEGIPHPSEYKAKRTKIPPAK